MLSLCTCSIASSLLEGSLELLFLMKSSITFYLASISVMSSNFPAFNWIIFFVYRKKCQGARLGMKWDGVHGHVCGKKLQNGQILLGWNIVLQKPINPVGPTCLSLDILSSKT